MVNDERIILFLVWCYAKFWDFLIGGKIIPGFKAVIQGNSRNTEFGRR
jgi:hypothetical protein